MTQNIVRQIRDEYQKGNTTLEKIANRYGLKIANVHRIVSNKTYKDAGYVSPQKAKLVKICEQCLILAPLCNDARLLANVIDGEKI